MGASTIYDVEVRYMMNDRAAASAAKLSGHLRSAGQHANFLSNAMREVGVAITGYLGIHQAYESFVKFNAEVEQTKIGMSTIFSMQLGKPFEDAQIMADKLFQEFQRFAIVTPMTTQEIHEFAMGVSSAVFTAGGNMQDFIKIAEQGSFAARTILKDTRLGAMQLTEMLNGTVRRTERFTVQLLGMMHISMEHWRAMTGKERIAAFNKLFDNPNLMKAEKAMETSFGGLSSTLVDMFQIGLAKAGAPLFEAIKSDMRQIIAWIGNHQVQIEAWSRKLGESLIVGWNGVKEVFSFVVRNKDVLLDIAKAWLVGKGAGAIVGGVSSMFTAFKGGIFGAVDALTKLAVASVAAADWWGSHQYKENVGEIETKNMTKTAEQALGGDRVAIGMLKNIAREKGWIDENGRFSEFKAWRSMGVNSLKEAREKVNATDWILGPNEELVKQLQALKYTAYVLNGELLDSTKALGRWNSMIGFVETVRQQRMPWELPEQARVAEKPTVNVTIQHIEVKSDDPDRFTFSLVESLRDVAKNPSGALNALREG